MTDLYSSDEEMDEIYIESPPPSMAASTAVLPNTINLHNRENRMDSPIPEEFFMFHSTESRWEINNNTYPAFPSSSSVGNRSMSTCFGSTSSISTDNSNKTRSHSVFYLRDDPMSPEARRTAMRTLLSIIYDDHSTPSSERDVTDTLTDTSLQSDCGGQPQKRRFNTFLLQKMDKTLLRDEIASLRTEVELCNNRLVRAVRQRGHQKTKLTARCAMVTAILQAISPKTSVDSRLKFSLVPLNGENGQEEWRQAMRAVTRLPGGIPEYFRVKLWTTLADNHITSSNIDWEEVKRTAFSEKVQDADEQIHSQIIKDLHRTGWDGFNDEKRLKQLLLAYARYNKDVGYCQGFNVIGALILQIVDYNTSDALKVLIFLIEQVLPRGYFDQSLRALSVDMSVMKDLLLQRLPRTVEHLEMLQSTSGNEYEPPLTNVFSMHWLLTLFATCLPRKCVFRIWDAVMLEGSEILLRTAIAIWAKLSRRVLTTKTADQFYGLMEKLSKQLVEMSELDQDSLLTVIYSMSEFPYPGLADLRDKYTWNIQPLSANFKLFQRSVDQILHEESDTETTCSPCRGSGKPKSHEKPWKSDVNLLQKQYKLMLKRQRQASVILHSAFLHGQSALSSRLPPSTVVPNMNITHQPMFNHLHMGHTLANQNISCEAPASLSGGALALAPTMVQPVEGETTPRNSPVPSRQYRSSHNFQREQCNITPTPTCNQLIDDVFISDCEDPYDSPTPYSPSIHKSPIQKRSAEQQAMMKRSKALLNTICTPPVPPPLPIPVGRRNQSYHV